MAKRRKSTKRKTTSKSKGHVPIKVLEKRLKRLNNIVKKRKGHYIHSLD